MTRPAPDPDASLGLLTGPSAADLLGTALATTGEELADWRVRHVDHRPGRGTTASYRATVRGVSGERLVTLGASTGLPGSERPSDGVHVVGARGQEVAVWRWPFDPELPGLADASRPSSVRALLQSYGIEADDVLLTVRAYRPRRRAVVEVRAGDVALFLKVVRPTRVEGLHRRHALLRGAGVPVPRSLGWRDDGLLVLEALRGTPLRERLRASGTDVPDGEALLALLDRLPVEVRDLPVRRSWCDAADHYAAVLGGALPEEHERGAHLARAIAERTAGAPTVDATHGDFYDAQVLLDGARVTGVLDVDTVGPGRRADDLACLLAHAEVLAQRDFGHGESTRRAVRQWLRAFDPVVDPAELRARTAGVVLSLATGPYRVQEPGWPEATRARLELVEQWLDGRAG